MKKYLSLFLALCMALGSMAFAVADGAFIPGTYEATAKGFGGDVTVSITVTADEITDVTVQGDAETPALGGVAIRPGDVIVADGDGVIAVPRCAAEQVALYASRELRNDQANRRAKYAALGWAPDETM